MKTSLLFLLVVSFIFISGCVDEKEKTSQGLAEGTEIKETRSLDNKPTPVIAPSVSLGNLCIGEEGCATFCQENRGKCEEYCKGNNNELCRIIFPPEQELEETKVTIIPREKTEIIQEDKPPVLKNLGVTIGPWDKKTNLAGDLIFTKKLIYDDGRVAGDKVFIDFGHADKYRTENKYSIEYWFFVPSGTNVYAPIDGTVQIGFIEHTQDWGISFNSEEWKSWIVSFEHIVDLNVHDGDYVKAGDIVAKAAPRINKEIAMVELAVWRPTRDHIYKFCPFEFLDESLKPMYEEKINQLVKDWEEFIGKDVYKQEDWVAPGCLLHNITER